MGYGENGIELPYDLFPTDEEDALVFPIKGMSFS